MAKYEAKTKPTKVSVATFLKGVTDDERREDCQTFVRMMKQITKTEPKMWGPSIVGFGNYHYKYASGHEGDCFRTGFAPRKGDLTLYIVPGFDQYSELMAKLGKHKTSKSCLYIKRLADVDLKVLKTLVSEGHKYMRKKYR